MNEDLQICDMCRSLVVSGYMLAKAGLLPAFGHEIGLPGWAGGQSAILMSLIWLHQCHDLLSTFSRLGLKSCVRVLVSHLI
jgi:hypothetical protein